LLGIDLLAQILDLVRQFLIRTGEGGQAFGEIAGLVLKLLDAVAELLDLGVLAVLMRLARGFLLVAFAEQLGVGGEGGATCEERRW